MPDKVPAEGQNEAPLLDLSGRIRKPEEIQADKKAEEHRAEKNYRQLLLDAETRQAQAQTLQARANLAIVRLTFALLIVSLIGGLVSYLQFRAADMNAKAAKSAADTAYKTLIEIQRGGTDTESTVRPWIVPQSMPPRNKPTIQEVVLQWNNAGKTPAVGVFSTAEFFIGEFPKKLRSCVELKRSIEQQPLGARQYAAFVAQDGRYETGLANTPPWSGPAPLGIHGCVWYSDVMSNAERTTEFFYDAFHNKFSFPSLSEGISLFYLQDRPFVYK